MDHNETPPWPDESILPADDPAADAMHEFLVEGELPVVPPAARAVDPARAEEDALLEQAGFEIVRLGETFQDEFLSERELDRRVRVRRLAHRGLAAGAASAAVVIAAFAVSLLVEWGDPATGPPRQMADGVQDASGLVRDFGRGAAPRSPDVRPEDPLSPGDIAASRPGDSAPTAPALARDAAPDAAASAGGGASPAGRPEGRPLQPRGGGPSSPLSAGSSGSSLERGAAAASRNVARNSPAPPRNGAPNVPAPAPTAVEPPARTSRLAAAPARFEGASPGPAPDVALDDPAAAAGNRVVPGDETAPSTTRAAALPVEGDGPADTAAVSDVAAVGAPPAAPTATAEDAPGAPAPSTPARVEPAAAVDANVPWRDLLAGYRTAYEQLDARLAKQVWPAVDESALARAFNALEAQTVTFEACKASLGSDRGIASCSGSATYVTGMGHRTRFTERRQWTFLLEKADERWVIGAVETR